jgi:hypothetical protein
MSRVKFRIAFAGFSILCFAATGRVAAVSPSNTLCLSSGGCSFPCTTGSSGTSEVLVNTGGSSQCAPYNGSNCSGSSTGICGVFYHYTGRNCDSGMIDDSYPVYSSFCGG